MAIFSGIGIPLSIITNNYAFIGIGPAIGVAVGIGIGQSIESKYREEGRLRPLNATEKRTRKRVVIAGMVFLCLGILAFLYFLLGR
jgi:predicted RND superfamily exporter protein